MNFRELFESKITAKDFKNLPKTIDAGKYDNAEYYSYSKKDGSYEYTQLEETPDGSGDFDDGQYNQGYSLNIDVELKDKQLYVNTEVKDLGRVAHKDFGKKYSGLTFDNIPAFEKAAKKIIADFDKI